MDMIDLEMVINEGKNGCRLEDQEGTGLHV